MSYFSAERTPSHYPGIRHGAHRCWDILTALLTTDGEVALPALWKVEHKRKYRRTNGENLNKLACEFERLEAPCAKPIFINQIT